MNKDPKLKIGHNFCVTKHFQACDIPLESLEKISPNTQPKIRTPTQTQKDIQSRFLSHEYGSGTENRS